MRKLARNFRPTMILHYPHSTDLVDRVERCKPVPSSKIGQGARLGIGVSGNARRRGRSVLEMEPERPVRDIRVEEPDTVMSSGHCQVNRLTGT